MVKSIKKKEALWGTFLLVKTNEIVHAGLLLPNVNFIFDSFGLLLQYDQLVCNRKGIKINITVIFLAANGDYFKVIDLEWKRCS